MLQHPLLGDECHPGGVSVMEGAFDLQRVGADGFCSPSSKSTVAELCVI